MSDTTSLDNYHAFTKAMLSGTDSWKELVAEDVLLIGPIGRFEGMEAFVEINTPFFASIIGHELHHVVQQGSVVVTQISVDVKLPTSAEITLQVSEWYEFRDGKIQSLRTYFDPEEYKAEMAKL